MKPKCLEHIIYEYQGHHNLQWNLSVTTTSIIKILPVIYSVMCFNYEDWIYQFIRANNFCLLELI